MGEPARQLEQQDQPRPRAGAQLTLVSSASELEEGDAWVLEAIMACYCTLRAPG